MSISRIEIKDLLVFNGEFSVDFCPGVNVLIGENGTGKTTLMKILYWSCEFSDKSEFGDDRILNLNTNSSEPYNKIFTLDSYFQNVSSNISIIDDTVSDIKIYWDVDDDDAPCFDVRVKKKLSTTTIYDIGLHTQRNLAFSKWCKLKIKSVFIPATEMLSHSRKLLAFNMERPIPFDSTEISIISKAELEPTREVTPNAKKVIDRITKIIGGTVEHDGNDFYIDKSVGNGDKIFFPFGASGFRKLGLLWKLLRNGLLEEGTVLFWDEPENSLNPELISVLVDILLELQQGGVQIFIATHSYDIARWFDLNSTEKNNLRYINFRRTCHGIEADLADSYISLPNNIIENAGDKLYERVVGAMAQNTGELPE
jgi:AAA15 family ATPase/GTPase